ncbi:MAG: IS1 family transposase [Chloroflexota bacterium]|nr:IS1 family transposase [Chloroflexota bacterium]
MIKTVQTHRCPHCGSSDLVKNGTDYKGAQKYHCRRCGAYGTVEARQRYSAADKARILRAYQERVSLRGLERIFGVARQTVLRWLRAAAAALPNLARTLAPPRADDILELDELWSFVHHKGNKRWVWIALCRRTRQIVAYYIGDRSEASCRALWQRIPATYKHCRTCSDFWDAYQKVLPATTHQSVTKASGQLAHVERWNNTLRQRLARFVRKSLSFSKSEVLHEAVLRLFIHRYNRDCLSVA